MRAWRARLVRPVRSLGSGRLAHSSSVTDSRARLRPANCCWIFGFLRSYSSWSAFSRASLLRRIGWHMCRYRWSSSGDDDKHGGAVLWGGEENGPLLLPALGYLVVDFFP